MILVDSNILIDVLENEQQWFQWSMDQLVNLAAERRVAVNQIAFAEVAPRLVDLETFRVRLTDFEIGFEPFDDEAAFVAGEAFLRYRTNRGGAKMVLPDFFIGGHAQVAGASILTRDPRFYHAYFPSVPLITPDEAEA